MPSFSDGGKKILFLLDTAEEMILACGSSLYDASLRSNVPLDEIITPFELGVAKSSVRTGVLMRTTKIATPDRNARKLVELRDRIGMMNLRNAGMAHEVLQRLTWLMSDPSIINTAIDDIENR